MKQLDLFFAVVRRSTALALLCILAVTHSFAQDSKGTDFWLMFNTNLSTPTLSLFITGDVNTTGMVEIPGLSVSTPFSVTAGAVTTVSITSGAMLTTFDGVQNRGIHITANNEVTVYGLNRVQFTTDAFLGLPTDILGTSYIVLGYSNTTAHGSAATLFGVVATQNATTVTIVPSVTTGSRTVGVPYNVTLNQGEAYQLANTGFGNTFDLSGTLITSDKPIAVFGGNQCTNIPATGGFTACDHVIEQLPPTSAWGQSFLTVPLATRTGGDTFRVLAAEDNTNVSINGVNVATLNKGQRHEQIITGSASIVANNAVLVAQYSNSSSFDNVTSDPFMMLIPPFEQFLGAYTITTPATGFATNFANIVAPSAAVGNITLDGVAIPPGSFTPIGASGFSGAQVPITLGSHNFVGNMPFGIFVYGFANFDSYGYPGGQSLSAVATVTSIALAPKTATNPVNTQHCVTATVRDQNQAPVPGVRVDFVVSGANTANGFSTTNAQGQAQFCYTGTNTGNDNIVASVGALSDDATKEWVGNGPPPDTTPPSCNITGLIPGPPRQLQITVQDVGSGLATVQVLTANNADVVVPAFTPGSTSPLLITATKINQSASSTIVLRVTDVAGNVTVCDPVYTQLSSTIPEQFELSQSYPNPFNPKTTIHFNVPRNTDGSVFVTLKVYDIMGREVKTLVEESVPAGEFSVEWDGTDNHGNIVAGGTYLYRMIAGDFVATKKVNFLK
jgi:hypothetical protein